MNAEDNLADMRKTLQDYLDKTSPEELRAELDKRKHLNCSSEPIYIEAPLFRPDLRFLLDSRKMLFLAGGITGVVDWQSEAYLQLKDINQLVICNPRRKTFNMNACKAESQIQIAWEHEHLELATEVIFWFGEETIQPIALFELGARFGDNKWRIPQWKQTLFIGAHPNYPRRFDLVEQARVAGYTNVIVDNLGELLTKVREFYKSSGVACETAKSS